MTPDSSPLLLFGAMLSTTVLLALGAAFGYWAGTHAAVRTAAADNSLRQADYLGRLANCVEVGQQSYELSTLVATLARNALSPLTPELSRALQQMSETTTGLAEQLRQLQASSKSIAAARAELAPTPRAGQEKRLEGKGEAEQASQRTHLRRSGGTALTSAEISEAIGDRQPASEVSKDREAIRYPYDCSQKMGIWAAGDELPALDRLVEVRCHDVSAGGISFFWPDKPEFERVVISIGGGDRLVFMAAEVCHHKAVYMHQQVSYIISCRFVRRVEMNSLECFAMANT